MENHFIWTDLSTFDISEAQWFYQAVFDWHYELGNDNYFNAYSKGKETSGLYAMPEKFVNMGMPSFWMSYIRVEDASDTAERAKVLGGRVEVKENIPGFGKIALIRDPLGAGFTVYEGHRLNGRTTNTPNTMVWNELIVSNSAPVIPFYTKLFNWSIRPENDDRFLIYDTQHIGMSAIQEVSNVVKGKHEYWAVFFGVNNMEHTSRLVVKMGGKVLYETASTVLCQDPFGAVFQVALV